MNRTLVIAAAILVAGAMIAGAILFVSTEGRSEEITTHSAPEALDYAEAGWRCEVPQRDGTYKPMGVSSLELWAMLENQAGQGELWADSRPARCTESSP
jgi:hypothetical protein